MRGPALSLALGCDPGFDPQPKVVSPLAPDGAAGGCERCAERTCYRALRTAERVGCRLMIRAAQPAPEMGYTRRYS